MQESSETIQENSQRKALERQAWEIGKSPFKQLFMYAFMMYMTGSTLSIFSIFILIPVLTMPITALSNIENTFKEFEGKGIDLTLSKVTFVFLHLCGVGMGLYKIHMMGLLPITSADWASLLPTQVPMEHSAEATPLS